MCTESDSFKRVAFGLKLEFCHFAGVVPERASQVAPQHDAAREPRRGAATAAANGPEQSGTEFGVVAASGPWAAALGGRQLRGQPPLAGLQRTLLTPLAPGDVGVARPDTQTVIISLY